MDVPLTELVFYTSFTDRLSRCSRKEAKVPDTDMERAVQRKAAFEKDPKRHTYTEEAEDG